MATGRISSYSCACVCVCVSQLRRILARSIAHKVHNDSRDGFHERKLAVKNGSEATDSCPSRKSCKELE